MGRGLPLSLSSGVPLRGLVCARCFTECSASEVEEEIQHLVGHIMLREPPSQQGSMLMRGLGEAAGRISRAENSPAVT